MHLLWGVQATSVTPDLFQATTVEQPKAQTLNQLVRNCVSTWMCMLYCKQVNQGLIYQMYDKQ